MHNRLFIISCAALALSGCTLTTNLQATNAPSVTIPTVQPTNVPPVKPTSTPTGTASITCDPSQRTAAFCTTDYAPVCATVTIECFKAPCYPIQKTFSNACEACKNPLVPSYKQGACPDILKTPTQTIDETQNGGTATMKMGDTLTLILNSTYWQIDGSSDTKVVRQDADPIYAPMLQGHVPGSGAGTVTTTFTAQTVGKAMITAHRTSCGEALACTGKQGTYSATITVQ